MGKISVYEIITNRIIETLEKGTVPWKKPWKTGAPINLISKKEYRGINTIILSMASFSSPYFATIRQINQLGGSVQKGAKGLPVVFWKFPKVKPEAESEKSPIKDAPSEDSSESKFKKPNVPLMRYYTVFNVEQCEGLESKIPVEETIIFDPIEKCEKVVASYPDKPPIEQSGQKACYRPLTDEIFMPVPESFDSSEHYYGTLFHELVHSTGHEKRLGREGVKDHSSFGDHLYSKEELVAEIGSSFLCGKTGLDISSIFSNQVAYIGSWLEALKNDKRMVIYAAAQAQKAVDHIMDVKVQEKTDEKSIAA